MALPIFAGDSTTVTPASLNVWILPCAVPFPPDTIAAQPQATKKGKLKLQFESLKCDVEKLENDFGQTES